MQEGIYLLDRLSHVAAPLQYKKKNKNGYFFLITFSGVIRPQTNSTGNLATEWKLQLRGIFDVVWRQPGLITGQRDCAVCPCVRH